MRSAATAATARTSSSPSWRRCGRPPRKLVARGPARGAAQGAGKAAGGAGRVVKLALDKLNPATLAAIVIKATSIQEQANAALRNNKSLYRIGGIEIGAAFPPSISFQIV